ncbi:hypothetical protein KIN20_013563 [Parelaphostrongylus tenuis]|uniref:Uncharacterized protein n=1 Tax=Parelaphostrongylus tenuis TaxID=148309 RepID=A0AAD5QMP2_PARTN|nr:hypothetical protein KIN20_013563 [Parelaphostrongylus tenuis]
MNRVSRSLAAGPFGSNSFGFLLLSTDDKMNVTVLHAPHLRSSCDRRVQLEIHVDPHRPQMLAYENCEDTLRLGKDVWLDDFMSIFKGFKFDQYFPATGTA